ncbi:MAG: hypothetical protein CM15mP42_10780 [Methanobacteriota archaeon]|nr:MAG: hypothetical protein CM15mP42_10780 [Euryarchaeota archaeon]
MLEEILFTANNCAVNIKKKKRPINIENIEDHTYNADSGLIVTDSSYFQ